MHHPDEQEPVNSDTEQIYPSHVSTSPEIDQQIRRDVVNRSAQLADETQTNTAASAAKNVQTDATGFRLDEQTAPNAVVDDVLEETASSATVFRRSCDMDYGFEVIDSTHLQGYQPTLQQTNVDKNDSYSVSVAMATGTNVDVHTDRRSATAIGSGSVGCMIFDAHPMAPRKVSGSAFVRSNRPGGGRWYVEVVDDDDDKVAEIRRHMAKVAMSFCDSNEDPIVSLQRSKSKLGTTRSENDDGTAATITVNEHVTDVVATAITRNGKFTASTSGYYKHDRQLIVCGEKLTINVKFHHDVDVANGIDWGVCNGKVGNNVDGKEVINIQLDHEFRGRAKFASLDGERTALSACRDYDVTTVDGELSANSKIHLIVDLCEMEIYGQKMTIALK